MYADPTLSTSPTSLFAQICHNCRLSCGPYHERSATRLGDHMQHGDAEHYRELAAHFRSLADTEPLPGLRRHLRQLAAQHDEVAAGLEEPQSDDDGAPGDALG
jgi:hypothetical protein